MAVPLAKDLLRIIDYQQKQLVGESEFSQLWYCTSRYYTGWLYLDKIGGTQSIPYFGEVNGLLSAYQGQYENGKQVEVTK